MLFMSEGFFLPNQNPFHCKLVSLDSWPTLPGKKRLRNISCMHVLPGFLKSSFIYMISIVILIYETITHCNYNVNFWAREETASDLNSYIFALLIIFFPLPIVDAKIEIYHTLVLFFFAWFFFSYICLFKLNMPSKTHVAGYEVTEITEDTESLLDSRQPQGLQIKSSIVFYQPVTYYCFILL